MTKPHLQIIGLVDAITNENIDHIASVYIDSENGLVFIVLIYEVKRVECAWEMIEMFAHSV